jgi:large subunit ribosomal protein L13
MDTYFPKAGEVQRKWYVVDASGLVLGRLAAFLAKVLTGKVKPEYTAHQDVGDFVVVVNADKIVVTGNKRSDKVYHRHTGYPGGLKSITMADLQKKAPEKVIVEAVSGMLPKNKLRQVYLKKLKVYGGNEHPHESQRPEALSPR